MFFFLIVNTYCNSFLKAKKCFNKTIITFPGAGPIKGAAKGGAHAGDPGKL